MESSNYTSGNWVLLETELINGSWCSRIQTNGIVINTEQHCYRSKGEAEANAKLIAAAPEMLQALDKIFFNAYDDDSTEEDLRSLIDFMRDAAQLAIDKATK